MFRINRFQFRTTIVYSFEKRLVWKQFLFNNRFVLKILTFENSFWKHAVLKKKSFSFQKLSLICFFNFKNNCFDLNIFFINEKIKVIFQNPDRKTKSFSKKNVTKRKKRKKKKVRGSAFSLSFNRNIKSITWKQSRYYIK